VTWLANYASVVGREFGALIGIACTINEPNIVAVMGYLLGVFPPQVTDDGRFVAVNEMMRKAHVAMREALREGPGTYRSGCRSRCRTMRPCPVASRRCTPCATRWRTSTCRACEGDDYLACSATPRWS